MSNLNPKNRDQEQQQTYAQNLVRPFSLLRKGRKAYEKLPFTMPFGHPILPALCKVDALDEFELTNLERVPMRDANGVDFILTFDSLPYGLTAPARYQAWKLSQSRNKRKKKPTS